MKGYIVPTEIMDVIISLSVLGFYKLYYLIVWS
jgi:hypothetical protein